MKKFINILICALHYTISWTIWIPSTISKCVNLRFVLYCLQNAPFISVFTSKVEGISISSMRAENHTNHSALCFATLFFTPFSLDSCNFLPPRYKFHTRQMFLRIFKIFYSIWKRDKVFRALPMTPSVLMCKLLNNLKRAY